MKKDNFFVFGIVFSLFIFTYSHGSHKAPRTTNDKKDYDKIVKIQSEVEHSISQTYDFDAKINYCDSVMSSLNEFIKKYSKGKWSESAKASLDTWKGRKDNLVSQQNSLISELSNPLRDKAIREAKSRHRISSIEKIDLISQSKHTEGFKLFLTNVYSVRMMGKILKKNIFNLKITTSGSISIDDKSIMVDDNANVSE